MSPQYLRRLAEDHAMVSAATARGDRVEASTDIDGEWTPAAGRDHLQARRDPESGRWRVDRDELARFMAQRVPPTVVIGFDLTCSAPKSISLLWAFGDGDLRADIEAALDAGVDAALDLAT